MNKINKILSILFIFAIIQSEYEVVDAFPNLSFVDPVGIHHAGDGSNRIFIVEQEGRIKVFDNDENQNTSQTFLDIR